MTMQIDSAGAGPAAEPEKVVQLSTRAMEDPRQGDETRPAATLPNAASPTKRRTRSERRRRSREAAKALPDTTASQAVAHSRKGMMLTPGTAGQYRKRIFHEKPEHTLWIK
jgi:hypothetical protein